MKNIIEKIPRLQGRQRQRSYMKNDGSIKGNNSEYVKLFANTAEDKPGVLDAGNKSERTLKLGKLNVNEEKPKIYAQDDLRRDENIFLLENYAELLVRKLRPLNYYCTRLLDRYSSDDLCSHSN